MKVRIRGCRLLFLAEGCLPRNSTESWLLPHFRTQGKTASASFKESGLFPFSRNRPDSFFKGSKNCC
ncbi:hypothetical protein HMPREF1326_02017 [Akkermansia sp. KLE1605]|nr:hypothetical protein HMPREF1326_02017 [Akkermansia sp. KLE1605]